MVFLRAWVVGVILAEFRFTGAAMSVYSEQPPLLGLVDGQTIGHRRKRSSNGGSRAGEVDAGVEGTSSASSVVPVPASGSGVASRPDGRKCSTCPHKDDQLDPVDLARGVRAPLWWGRPKDPLTGATKGLTCGYCVKIYCAKAKHRKIGGKPMTLPLWEVELGSGEGALSKHHLLVGVVIKLMIEKGCNRAVRPLWDLLEGRVLKLYQISQISIKKPGFQHYSIQDYAAAHPEGLDHFRKDGHREFTLKGVIGILVPSKGPTLIEFSDITQASVEGVADDGLDLLDDTQLETKASEIMRGLDITHSGSFSGLHALQSGEVPAASPSTATSSASGNGSREQGRPLASAAKQPPRPKAVSAASSPPTPKPPPSIRIDGDSAPSSGGGGSGKRGRPIKDFIVEVNTLLLRFFEAADVDPNFWGAEALTELKAISKLAKAVQDRAKKATEMEEAQQLAVQQKCTLAIYALVEVVNTSGLDHESFCTVFDYQNTLLNLEPKAPANFKWPKHILWTRHKVELRRTTDTVIWIKRCSSTELAQHGCADFRGQQIKLLSERIASLVKAATIKDVKDQLKQFFCSSEHVFDFTADINNFCDAMNVLCEPEAFDDLKERIEVMEDATKIVSAQIPSEGNEGSALGNALIAWPKGRHFYDEAKAYLKSAKTTLHVFKSLELKMASWEAALKPIESLGDCADAAIDCVVQLTDAIVGVYTESEKDCLKEELANMLGPGFKAALAGWSTILVGDWAALLKPLLTETCDEARVEEWVSAQSEMQTRLNRCTESTLKAQVLFDPEGADSCMPLRYSKLSAWVNAAHAFVKESPEGRGRVERAKRLRQGMVAAISDTQLLEGADHAAIRAFADSRFLARDGQLGLAILAALKGDSKTYMDPLKAGFVSFGFETVGKVEIGLRLDDDLAKLSSWQIRSDIFADAAKWATDAEDEFTRLQVSFLQHYHAVVKALAACEFIKRLTLPLDTIQARQISKEHVAAVKCLRSANAALSTFKNSGGLLKLVNGPTSFHCDVLDDLILYEEAVKDTFQSSLDVVASLAIMWRRDLISLKDQIDEACPKWSHFKETLLRNPVVLAALVDNIKHKYTQIGPMCNMVKDTLKSIKAIHADSHGFIIEPTLVAELKDIADYGVETVAYTYFAWHYMTDLPQVDSLPMRKKKVDDLIQKITKDHKVTLSTEILEALDAYKKGEPLPTAAALASTPARPPELPAAVPLAEPLAAAAGAAAAPEAEPEPGATDASKRSLADRLKARNVKIRLDSA
jgi:hypothetical protein